MRLTIAIPTYNRSDYLARQLELLVPQVGLYENVDILVCDNHSTDATNAKVSFYNEEFPRLQYRRNDKNIGFDGNFFQCCRSVTSDYIWFLADDDFVVAGAVKKVWDIILAKKPEVLVMGSRQKGESSELQEGFEDLTLSDFGSLFVDNIWKAIMLSALIIRRPPKEDIEFLATKRPSIFPQISMVLRILQKRFVFCTSPMVVIERDPGFVTNDFFWLYCIGPRIAIRNAATDFATDQLLASTETMLRDFVGLQFLERIGYYHSRNGLSEETLAEAVREYGYSAENMRIIKKIVGLGRLPKTLAVAIFYWKEMIRSGSIWKAHRAFRNLFSGRREKVGDV